MCKKYGSNRNMRQSHICIDLVTCLAVCVHCSIQLSPKPDSSIHIPSVTTNTGSLPDLSGLQFTSSPPDDSTSDSTYHHIGPMRSSVAHSSPASRHGRARPGPKPLVLHSPSHTAYQVTAHDAYIHPFCPGLPTQVPFMPPSQQRQSNEGNTAHDTRCYFYVLSKADVTCFSVL